MDPFLSIDPFYNPTLIFQFESIIKNKDMNYLLLIKKELNNVSLLLKKKTIIK